MGDGWIPAQVSVDEIARGQAKPDSFAEQVGRDPQTLEIFAFGMPGEFRSREELMALEQARAADVTILLTETEPGEATAEWEALAVDAHLSREDACAAR